ncbi:hypothetical protein TruAng_005762 [Truncatella angustata]|nr:hypothetical protein TruAng_005762 [Truncatella angustata]
MDNQSAVQTGKVWDIIRDVQSGRKGSVLAHNQPNFENVDSSSGTARKHSSQLSVPPGSGGPPSLPSTVYDRGDSESLQDAIQFAQHLPSTSHPADIAQTGTWQAPDSQDMASKLRAAMVQSYRGKSEGKTFLPRNALQKIVTKEAVQQELERKGIDNPSWPAQICNIITYRDDNERKRNTSRRKIFATLVMIKEVQLVNDFLTQGIWDSHLPLKVCKDEGKENTLCPRNNKSKPALSNENDILRWSFNDVGLFESHQWFVTVPYFTKVTEPMDKVHFYPLSSNDILPFIECLETLEDEKERRSFLFGHNATVDRIKIHPDHHNFDVRIGNSGADFAVKRLVDNGNSKQAFDREVDALKRFSQRKERYIINLLATYAVDGQYHLLFPIADGNLRTFWKQSPGSEIIPGAALWLAQECQGIAAALAKIHNLTASMRADLELHSSHYRAYGIHGDIKPENVLWFKNMPSHLVETGVEEGNKSIGFLQISDFGTVNFHGTNTATYNQIPVIHTTYAAPESDSGRNSLGSAAIDVWALGCVYLEFITWYLKGSRSTEDDFTEIRVREEQEMDAENEGVAQDKFFIKRKTWVTGKEYHIIKPDILEVRSLGP